MSSEIDQELDSVREYVGDLEADIAGLKDEIAERDELIQSLESRLESAQETIDDLTRELTEQKDEP